MKKSICRDLLGPCDAEILGVSPEEMGENSKRHVMEMVQSGDEAHKKAIEYMQQMSKGDYQKWYGDFKKSFAALPDA